MKSSTAQAQEARITHLQGEITALQKQQENNHTDITAQAQEHEARITHLQGEITALQKQQENNHTDITAQAQEYEARITHLQGEITALQKQQEQEARITHLQGEITALQKQQENNHTDITAQAQEYEARITHLQGEITALQKQQEQEARITHLQGEITALQKQQEQEARITHLQGEITALQKQQENNHTDITAHFGKRVQDALLAMTGHSTQLKGAEDKLKVEIRDMEEDLARQAEMNRIVLTKCNVATMEKSDRKLVQQHRLTGHCYEQAFQVEFTLTDVMEDASVVRTVTDLNIVMDGSEFSHFSTFVSGVEDKRSLLLFFQTLRRFLERCEDRRRTFQHFQEKYPEVVLLPGSSRSEVMLIQNPQLPGCALTIHWTIEVTQDGVITPQIDLVTKMPEQALQVDSSKVVKNAPESFRSLVGILGVEASIESIIQSVS